MNQPSKALASLLVITMSACGVGGGGGGGGGGGSEAVQSVSGITTTDLQRIPTAHANFGANATRMHGALLGPGGVVDLADSLLAVDVSTEAGRAEYLALHVQLDDQMRGSLAVLGAFARHSESLDALHQSIRDKQMAAQLEARPNGFVFILAGGLAISGYLAYRAGAKAIDKKHDTTRHIIGKTNDAGRAQIAEAMRDSGIDVPTGATQQQLLEAFNTASINARNSVNRELIGLALAEADGDAIAQDKKNTVEAAVQLGEVALTTTVSATLTVTGGQGVDKLAGLAAQGGGATVSNAVLAGQAVDLALSATEYQPLDIFSRHLQTTTVSQEHRVVAVEQPSVPVSPDEARELIDTMAESDPGALTVTEILDASNALINEAGKVAPGQSTVLAPARVHTQEVDLASDDNASTPGHYVYQVAEGTPFLVPGDMVSQLVDVGVTSAGRIFDLFESIRPTDQPVLFLNQKRITPEAADSLIEGGEEIEIDGETFRVDSLSITASPASPSAGEDVSVTVTVQPPQPNVPVSYQVAGSDGYGDSGTLRTNGHGQIHFSIPGGAESVVDQITVDVGPLSATYSYSFH